MAKRKAKQPQEAGWHVTWRDGRYVFGDVKHSTCIPLDDDAELAKLTKAQKDFVRVAITGLYTREILNDEEATFRAVFDAVAAKLRDKELGELSRAGVIGKISEKRRRMEVSGKTWIELMAAEDFKKSRRVDCAKKAALKLNLSERTVWNHLNELELWKADRDTLRDRFKK